MKTYSNKTKKKPTATVKEKFPDTSMKPSYNVEAIDNGFVIRKSWCDAKGKYHSSAQYTKENPLDEDFSEKE